MKKSIISFILFAIAFSSNMIYAQEKIIYGHIIDAESLEPLAGVSITTQLHDIGTISDSDGLFSMRINNHISHIYISFIGYEQLTIDISNKVDLGFIKMKQNGLLLKDILITAQLALPRKTPIAVSSVTRSFIDEYLGNKEFVEILKHTPGVHANRQGGGWADSEIYMRGFDNSNIAVMINGIPVNDPENGIVYWSNWASLSDAASTVQSQRGIGSGKVASPSVGGTINIITKGIETQKGGSISYGVGNEGFQKFFFSISSGLLSNGWSLTLQGGGSSGNGYFQGGNFKVKDFFINVSKRLGKSHQISLTSFGSFQEHYSRSDALTRSEWNKVRSLYAIDGHWTRYNPELGFNSEGQRRSAKFEHFNNAMIFVNHIWQIDPKSSLSTNFYYSLGKGFSHSGLADEDEFSEYDWYAADYGILNTKFRTKNGTFDYSKIEDINTASAKGSLLVMSKTIGNYGTLGLVSTYKNSLSNFINLTTGLDIRSYKGLHKNTLQDLLGGEYYIDPGRKDVDIENNPIATDLWKNAHLGIGDILYRDYDSHIVQEGCFAQVEYANKSFSTFISSAISYSHIWRFDRFYYSRDNSKSKIANYWGGNIKTGANYNINENHNIYANLGYVSRAPKFKGGVFMSATSSHTINKKAANEKAVSAELGYGFHNKYLDLDINAYLIEWLDKAMAKKGKLGGQYYLNMTGVNSLHIGIESAFKVKPTRWIDISGMVSIGEWKWYSNNVKGYAYNLSGQAITTEGKVTTPGSADHAWALINMKGIHVGGSAQTTASIDISFKPFNGLKIGSAYTFFDRNYAYYSLSGSNLSIGKELYVSQPWKVPSGGSWDANISYSFKIANMNASIFAQINNIANSHYIEKAWNPSNVSSTKQTVNPDDVYMFYSLGRMWSIKLKISF
ncbi:MAG: TonB-dependent receptor plug domain-containing protein [Bacteroidales bacterium]|nr:TonB-dependent receptor plug domain-containing protein [Bacteroidales bacterium]